MNQHIARARDLTAIARTAVTAISKKVIAVVDDDSGLRKALKNLLSVFGYAVYVFDSAEAFLRAAPASKAECLVIDVRLPGISGIELARELSVAGFKFPIIFMTSADDDAIGRQAMQLGCVAFLRKPFGSDALIEAIVTATGQGSD